MFQTEIVHYYHFAFSSIAQHVVRFIPNPPRSGILLQNKNSSICRRQKMPDQRNETFITFSYTFTTGPGPFPVAIVAVATFSPTVPFCVHASWLRLLDNTQVSISSSVNSCRNRNNAHRGARVYPIPHGFRLTSRCPKGANIIHCQRA